MHSAHNAQNKWFGILGGPLTELSDRLSSLNGLFGHRPVIKNQYTPALPAVTFPSHLFTGQTPSWGLGTQSEGSRIVH